MVAVWQNELKFRGKINDRRSDGRGGVLSPAHADLALPTIEMDGLGAALAAEAGRLRCIATIFLSLRADGDCWRPNMINARCSFKLQAAAANPTYPGAQLCEGGDLKKVERS